MECKVDGGSSCFFGGDEEKCGLDPLGSGTCLGEDQNLTSNVTAQELVERGKQRAASGQNPRSRSIVWGDRKPEP